MPIDDAARCPCLSGHLYGECCGPVHRGERAAPTAETLMRARYSAFAVGDATFLRASWHPRTRPTSLDLGEEVRWVRLDVLGTEEGGPFDDSGVVEFVAHHRGPDGRGSLHERSRFVREGGRWLYVDGDVG